MERSITVAVVDANAATRQGLMRRLAQLPGISVVGEAGDPDGALGIVGNRQPDVIVTDLRRIAPTGAEFLRRLEAVAPHAAIIVLTAYVTERERADLRRAGARAILLKEIRSETLFQAIQTLGAKETTGGATP